MNGSTMSNYQWEISWLSERKLKNHSGRTFLLVIIKLSLSVLPVKFILYVIYELLMKNSDEASQKTLLI